MRRDRAGRYPKGVSGNPDGRPREVSDLRRAMRGLVVPVAIEVLLEAMAQRKNLNARVRAAQVALLYGLGQPGVVKDDEEAPSGTFELKLIVEDTPATREGPEPRPDLPGGGGEASEDSDSLLPSSGVPPAEA